MPRDFTAIAADFDSLTSRDFDYSNAGVRGLERLYELCDEMSALNDPARCAPVMFRTMERLDGVELGTPGLIVHTLEAWRGNYEALLAQSVRRKPTSLSVWMIHRILNTHPADSESWVNLLRGVANNPDASAATRLDAERFIRYQNGH